MTPIEEIFEALIENESINQDTTDKILQIEQMYIESIEQLETENLRQWQLLKMVWDFNKPDLDENVQARIRRYYDNNATKS